MTICIYHKLQAISFSLDLLRNRWCPVYTEINLQSYVQKNHTGEIKSCNSWLFNCGVKLSRAVIQ